MWSVLFGSGVGGRAARLTLLAFAVASCAMAVNYTRSRDIVNIVGNAVSNTHTSDQIQTDNQRAPLDATARASGDSETSVRINGRELNVPSGGSVHKVTHDVSGTTTIDISNSSSTSGDNTTIDLQVESHSSTSGYSDST